MKISNLLKKLNTKLPKDSNKEIVFLNILRSKKYYKDFFAYSKSEKFYEFFEYSALKNKKEFFSYVNKLIKTEKNNFKNRTYQKFWLIIDKKNKKLIGSAKLNNLDPVRKSVEWGYGINPKFWGKNYILRIQYALIDYIFNKLNLNRLYGHTHIKNKRVINGIKKLAFRNEGVKKDYYYHQEKKEFMDAYSYSLLKRDYIENNKIFFKKKGSSKINIKIYYAKINSVILKIIKKNFTSKKNLNMNEISEWDSITHFDIISAIEKKFNKKFTNDEILKSTSTKNIFQILNKK